MIPGLILGSGYCLCGQSVHLFMYMLVSFKLSGFLSALEENVPEGGLVMLGLYVSVHNIL